MASLMIWLDPVTNVYSGHIRDKDLELMLLMARLLSKTTLRKIMEVKKCIREQLLY